MARSASEPALNLGRFLLDLVLAILSVWALAWAVTRWVAVPFAVDGTSMSPTLRDGDRVLVLIASLSHDEPAVGDVVLLLGPGDEYLVKRVAPREALGPQPPAPALARDSPLEPDYVVLGDNPAASRDSRSFGPVPRHRIRGRLLWRYWPPSRIGRIE